MSTPRRSRRLRWAAAAFVAAALVVWASIFYFVWRGPTDGMPPEIGGLPPGYRTALQVPADLEGETEQAWTQLGAAIDLVRSSHETLTQAEALRDAAARLAQISREYVEARREELDPAVLESARYQQLIAETQLALAADLLAKARRVSEGALAIFEIARQNASRLQDGDESQDSADDVRIDPRDLVRACWPPAAVRGSRRA